MKVILFLSMLFVMSNNGFSQKKILADRLGEFKNGYGYIEYKNKVSLLDTLGNILDIPELSATNYEISNNVITLWPRSYIDYAVSYYDLSGKLIKAYDYNLMSTGFHDGIAVIINEAKTNRPATMRRYSDETQFSITFLNTNCQKVFSKISSSTLAPIFDNGYGIMNDLNGNTIIINKNGKITGTIKIPNFTYGFHNYRSIIQITKDNQFDYFAFIDTTGKIYNEIQFSNQPESFSNGLSLIKNAEGRYGFMNTEGKIVIKPTYRKAYTFNSNLTVVQEVSEERFLIINTKGDIIKEIKGFYPESGVNDGLVKVSKGGKYGYVDVSGSIKIEIKYDVLSNFNSNRAYFRESSSDRQGYLNRTGETVLISTKSEY